MKIFILILPLFVNLSFACKSSTKELYEKETVENERSTRRVLYNVANAIICNDCSDPITLKKSVEVDYSSSVADLWEIAPNFRKIIDGEINDNHIKAVSFLLSYDDQINGNKSNLTGLKMVKNQLESAYVISRLMVESNTTKASLYPILNSWAFMHFKLYKLLIGYGEPLEEKHDGWVVFYAQLILRYWRPYTEHKLNIGDNFSKLPSKSPAAWMIADWPKLMYNTNYRKSMEDMIQSCKGKDGELVSLNLINKGNSMEKDLEVGDFVEIVYPLAIDYDDGTSDKFVSSVEAHYQITNIHTTQPGYNYEVNLKRRQEYPFLLEFFTIFDGDRVRFSKSVRTKPQFSRQDILKDNIYEIEVHGAETLNTQIPREPTW